MRVFLHAVLIVSLAAGALVIAQGGRGQGGGDASKVLAATRQALGGEEKLAAVKSFVATGRTRQVSGNNLVPIEFEIVCELPDKYVRRDEIPARESGPTSSGFNGDGLIQIPPPPELPAGVRPAAPASAPPVAAGNPATKSAPAPGPAAGIPGAAPGPPGRAGGLPAAAPDPRKARVASLKQDFVRLTLGMFAASFPSYPLTFTLGGVAEAPQGKADIIDVKGPATFTARLFVNSETHLPIMVSWTMPAPNAAQGAAGRPSPENLRPGSPTAAPAPPPTASKQEQAGDAKQVQDLQVKTLKAAPPKPVEYRIYYADYRDIGNGIKFPFRLRRAVAGETVEETNFDNFRINGRIDARRFEVVK